VRSPAWAWAVVAAAEVGAAAGPPAAFFDVTHVEVVELQVFVTDAAGEPVSGLDRAAFRLLVDGEERPITNFYAAAEAREAAAAPAPASPAVAAPVAVEAEPLSLVVLLDELHLEPRQRRRVLERLGSLLDKRLAAGDDVLLASFDRSLRILRPFDADGDLAVDLAAAQRRAPGGVSSALQRRQTLAEIRDLEATHGCEMVDLMDSLARAWTAAATDEVRQSLEAVRTLSGALAGRPGPKALLLVTSGLPLDPGLEATLLLDELCNTGRGGASSGLANEVAAVVRAANAAQVTLYTLDAGGPQILGSAQEAGSGLELGNQAAVRGNLHDAIFAFAHDTGGRALLESNQPERLLADLDRDLASYYSLGFAARPTDASRSHRIAVELTVPGLRARHRLTWSSLDGQERLEAALLAALHLGGGGADTLHASLAVGAPVKLADGRWGVELRVQVPASTLALVPSPDGSRRDGSLTVYVAVADARGRTTPIRKLTLPVALAAASQAVEAPLRLRLAAGDNRVAIAVRDDLSGQLSVLLRTVRGGEPPGSSR
jgi:VWFA-related protein